MQIDSFISMVHIGYFQLSIFTYFKIYGMLAKILNTQAQDYANGSHAL